MKIGEAVQMIKRALQGIYDEGERSTIAHWLAEEATGLSRTDLLLSKTTPLTPKQEKELDGFLQRLQQHEPLQYVLNKAWFYGMQLYVDKNVLIPRRETEELVDWMVQDINTTGLSVSERHPVQADATRQLRILDIGTGSGCIALAFKKAVPWAEVWGCDISEEALNVARRNGAWLDIRVDFQGVNFLDETQRTFLPAVDLIVSNPPYIPLRDKDAMAKNVLDYEPHTALFVPDNDALLFYKAIARFAKTHLHENGAIYLEIHEDLSSDVAHLFRSEGYSQVEIKKDMQGKERMVRASAAPTGGGAQI